MVKTEQNILSESSKVISSSSSAAAAGATAAACKRKYKGVRMRSWGSYVSEIRAPNQKTRIWLGSYSTPEAAARAYDAALLCLKGTSANFNFPINTSSHYIPQDMVMSPKSIQRVAAAAANNFLDNDTTTTFTTTTTTTPSPNPAPSSSSSSSMSSPSMSSSPFDQLEDDVSLMPAFGNYTSTIEPCFGAYTNTYEVANNEPMAMPWYEYNFDGLQSYTHDHLFNGGLFDDSPLIEDEVGDIRLWSFC